MPDWQKLVSERLWNLALESKECREVIEELAAHLEESYERFRKEGLAEHEAVHQTLAQVTDWSNLGWKIGSARSRKDTMTNRVTQLWLPGLLTFVLSTGIFALFEIFQAKAWVVARSSNMPLLVFHFPWLLSLPVVGALGAYLSWRAGGSRSAMLSSTVFPVLPLLASILVWLPFSLFFYFSRNNFDFVPLYQNGSVGRNSAPMAGFMALIGFVLVPALALLAGGLPTQLYFSRRLTSRGAGN